MTPELTHDLLMLFAWPILTAVVNGLVVMAGKSHHPMAQVLAKIGTTLLSAKKSSDTP